MEIPEQTYFRKNITQTSVNSCRHFQGNLEVIDAIVHSPRCDLQNTVEQNNNACGIIMSSRIIVPKQPLELQRAQCRVKLRYCSI